MLTLIVKGSFSEAKKSILNANKKAEAVEFRLDLFEKADLDFVSKLMQLSSLPVIFTLRKVSHGGRFSGSEQERESKLFELLASKPAYIDLEHDSNPEFIDRVSRTCSDLILSYHNFEETPEGLEAILEKMKHSSAAIYKIATHANSSLDALRMLIFVKKMRQKGIPIAGMCMGGKGGWARVLAPIVDSLITYAVLEKGEEVVPGQLTLAELETVYHFSQLDRQTDIYALIGNPVAKSIGHLVHNHYLRLYKRNAVYVKIDLGAEEIPPFFQLIKELSFKGFSVTMPLKEQMTVHLDEIHSEVTAINTLAFLSGKWRGFNTDGRGALNAIEKKAFVKGKKIVIFGAGGAAKAIAFEAIKRGGKVTVVNRTKEKALKLAAQLVSDYKNPISYLYPDLPAIHSAERAGSLKQAVKRERTVEQDKDGLNKSTDFCNQTLRCIGLSLIEWENSQKAYEILINTIPVPESPVLEKTIIPGSIVFDAVSSPIETKLLHLAKRKGALAVYGYEMYAEQALMQLEIWLDRSLDRMTIINEISELSRSPKSNF